MSAFLLGVPLINSQICDKIYWLFGNITTPMTETDEYFKVFLAVTAAGTAVLWNKAAVVSNPPLVLHGLRNKLSFRCKNPARDGLKY
jgi:hypothetical protein